MFSLPLGACELVISALESHYPTLESILIVSYTRPDEQEMYPKLSLAELRLMRILEQGGIDSKKLRRNLIEKIRHERFNQSFPSRSWWQSKGYHCWMDYEEKIYNDP